MHFTDGQSPWQNGPTEERERERERDGEAFKDIMDKVVLDATVTNNEEQHEATDLLVVQRNARADLSGISLEHLSLGKNAGVPGHMLADDSSMPIS